MMAGRTPYVGNVYHAVLVDICTRDASDVRLLAPLVPEAIAQIIARALSRERAARYPDAQAFLDALAPFSHAPVSSAASLLASSATMVSQPTPPKPTIPAAAKNAERHQKRLGKVVVAILLLALAAAATTMNVLHRRFKSQHTQMAAKVAGYSPSVEGARVLQRTSANSAASETAVSSSAALTSQPTAIPSATAQGLRHPMGDAGTASSRPARAPVGATNELQLKTKMP
jgi:serine/threonine-protein kinase